MYSVNKLMREVKKFKKYHNKDSGVLKHIDYEMKIEIEMMCDSFKWLNEYIRKTIEVEEKIHEITKEKGIAKIIMGYVEEMNEFECNEYNLKQKLNPYFLINSPVDQNLGITSTVDYVSFIIEEVFRHFDHTKYNKLRIKNGFFNSRSRKLDDPNAIINHGKYGYVKFSYNRRNIRFDFSVRRHNDITHFIHKKITRN